MTLEEYQRLALRTASSGSHSNLITAALGLAGEAGEFADTVKKWYAQGHDMETERLIHEAGDILWYLSLAASALGVGLDEVAQRNIDKLEKRYGGSFSSERSQNREAEGV